mgnify:CR=1 FL=1
MKIYNRTITGILTVLLAVFSYDTALAQWIKPEGDTLKILLVGNSFSQNATHRTAVTPSYWDMPNFRPARWSGTGTAP